MSKKTTFTTDSKIPDDLGNMSQAIVSTDNTVFVVSSEVILHSSKASLTEGYRAQPVPNTHKHLSKKAAVLPPHLPILQSDTDPAVHPADFPQIEPGVPTIAQLSA